RARSSRPQCRLEAIGTVLDNVQCELSLLELLRGVDGERRPALPGAGPERPGKAGGCRQQQRRGDPPEAAHAPPPKVRSVERSPQRRPESLRDLGAWKLPGGSGQCLQSFQLALAPDARTEVLPHLRLLGR